MADRKPKFRIMHNDWKVADVINEPHEDYPLRVRKSAEALIALQKIVSCTGYVDEFLGKAVHGMVFATEDHRGKYRDIEVQVGDYTPLPSAIVPEAIKNIFPTISLVSRPEQEVKQHLIDWYITFETIHPFQDGNGRVGGIILAALSWWYLGEYIVPCDHDYRGLDLVDYETHDGN